MGGCPEKLKIRLASASTRLEVGVRAELGNNVINIWIII